MFFFSFKFGCTLIIVKFYGQDWHHGTSKYWCKAKWSLIYTTCNIEVVQLLRNRTRYKLARGKCQIAREIISVQSNRHTEKRSNYAPLSDLRVRCPTTIPIVRSVKATFLISTRDDAVLTQCNLSPKLQV